MQRKEVKLQAGPVGVLLGRFNFTLTHSPGSQNVKPDALSRQFSPDLIDTDSGPLLSCIVGSAKWQVKERVREAQSSVSSPAETPPNRLFIPESVHSEVLQWQCIKHARREDCRPQTEVPPRSGDRFVVLSGVQRAFHWAIIHSPTGNLRGANQSLESAWWPACNWLSGARFCLEWNMYITRSSAEVTHLRVIIWKL